MGSKEGQSNEPSGVTLYNNQVYVSDRNNHRIQVFDMDFIGSIGSHGEGRGGLSHIIKRSLRSTIQGDQCF